MLSNKPDSVRQGIIQEHINHYYNNQTQFNKLTLDSEYQTFIGKKYEDFRKQDGKIRGSKTQLKQADISAVKKLYVYGHDRQKIIQTVMRKSPATQKMGVNDRQRYEKLLHKTMKGVEPQRKEKQHQKQIYGINNNCKRDIDSYLNCMKAEQNARSKGMMIPHLNYREFQKKNDPNYHLKYTADLKQKMVKQDKMDRERQQKITQQKQQTMKVKR